MVCINHSSAPGLWSALWKCTLAMVFDDAIALHFTSCSCLPHLSSYLWSAGRPMFFGGQMQWQTVVCKPTSNCSFKSWFPISSNYFASPDIQNKCSLVLCLTQTIIITASGLTCCPCGNISSLKCNLFSKSFTMAALFSRIESSVANCRGLRFFFVAPWFAL